VPRRAPEVWSFRIQEISSPLSYERGDSNPEHAKGRETIEQILTGLPALTADNPYWRGKRGKRWLKEYSAMTDKFQHNHDRYRFYAEE
jgi:hypothetical protein